MKTVLFLVASLPLVGASSASASSAAQAWLRSHTGSPDQLDELKGTNPEAYAIVQALLTKRSLGLLNAKHPTASFAAPAPQAQAEAEEPVERGPEAFAKFASPGEVHTSMVAAAPKVELPYASIKSAHHDWLNWKPHSSGADEAMVANVLGMVGGMKGSHAAPVEAPAEVAEPAAAEPVVADAAPVAAEPVHKASSDWGSIGSMLGLHKQVQQRATTVATTDVEAPRPSFRGNYFSEHRAAAESLPQKAAGSDWNSVEKAKQNSDDKAVTNLLNMVAQLKGAKADKLLKKHHIKTAEDNALSGDLAAWGDSPDEVQGSIPAAHVEAPRQFEAPVTEIAIAPPAPVVEAPPAPPVREVATPAVAPVEVPVIDKGMSWGNIGAAFSNPSATPAVEAPAPEKVSSWGSIGSMLGLHHKTVQVEAPQPQLASANAAAEGMPAEIQALVSSNDRPMHRAAPPAAQTKNYKSEADKKQNADDTAVKSLLSMVAQLRGSKKAAQLAEKYDHGDDEQKEENPLSNDIGMFGNTPTEPQPVEAPAAVQATQVASIMVDATQPAAEVDEAPAAPARKKNLFLDSLTSSLREAQIQPHRHNAALVKESSKQSKKSAFASSAYSKWFSADDSEDNTPQVKVPTKRQNSKLLSWLDPETQSSAKAQSISQQPQAPVNAYLADLQ